MLIAIFGESCVGKSTLADKLRTQLSASVYTGKDYLRLNKNEAAARQAFQALLSDAVKGENMIYVISEREHLQLVPDGAIRVLVTADLDTIKERFARRMRGTLPAPVAMMLKKKHGCFDSEPHDLHVSAETDPEQACQSICDRIL